MQQRNILALSFFALFYVIFGSYLTLFQERIVYLPNEQDFNDCPALAEATQVNHQGTRMYVEPGEQGTVVLYHGNAGSACDRAFLAERFKQAGWGYLLPEYAGYSNDEQKPSHELIKQDVRNVIDYLESQATGTVAIMGVSIGTGVASYHTSLAPPDRLLLISPFTDLVAVARDRFWFYPTSFLVDNAYDNVINLSNYQGQVVVVHGAKDTIIDPRLSQALYDSLATDKKTRHVVDDRGHNDVFLDPETFAILTQFLIVSDEQ